MTLSEQIEDILPETIAALCHLQPEELERLEGRLLELVGSRGAGSVTTTEGLREKMDLLGVCLSTTAENLQVLDRIRGRGEI